MLIQSLLYKRGSSGKTVQAELIANYFKLNEIMHSYKVFRIAVIENALKII